MLEKFQTLKSFTETFAEQHKIKREFWKKEKGRTNLKEKESVEIYRKYKN